MLLISIIQKSVSRKLFVFAFYQFWKGISAGPALNIEHDSQGRAAPPKNGQLYSGRPRTKRFPTFLYCQVVNCQLLRLLSTHILKVTKILYQCILLLNPFWFCETWDLHFTTRVFGHSAITPFLGGSINCTIFYKLLWGPSRYLVSLTAANVLQLGVFRF